MATRTIAVPFYATVFRSDGFADALQEIAPLSLRYGAKRYFLFRGGDDPYRFVVYFDFEDAAAWQRFWYGPDFNAWREKYSSWYQIPLVYDVGETLLEGRSEIADDDDTTADEAA